jgi:hypothetical protein
MPEGTATTTQPGNLSMILEEQGVSHKLIAELRDRLSPVSNCSPTSEAKEDAVRSSFHIERAAYNSRDINTALRVILEELNI